MKRSKKAKMAAWSAAQLQAATHAAVKPARRDAGIVISFTLVLFILKVLIGNSALLTALLFTCIPLFILWIFLHKDGVEPLGNHLHSISTVLMMPFLVCITLAFTGGASHILDWRQVMAVAILITVVLLLLFIFAMIRAGGISTLLLIAMIPISYFAAYNVVLQENRLLDKSEEKQYEVTILDKWIDRKGKIKSYYFKLAPWGDQTEAITVTAGGLYSVKEVNDKVHVYHHEGAFHMPWFSIEK